MTEAHKVKKVEFYTKLIERNPIHPDIGKKVEYVLIKKDNPFNPVKNEFAEILYSDSDNEELAPILNSTSFKRMKSNIEMTNVESEMTDQIIELR